MSKPSPPSRPEYYVQTGSMFENPHGVPHEEIVSMILELPAEMAAQVIFGKYVESSGLVFTGELIQMLFDRDGRHYHGESPGRITGDNWIDRRTLQQARLMSSEQKRTVFATGIDFARLNDFTVLFTLDLRTRPARVVAYRRLNRVPWEGIYREVGRVVYSWGPNVLADATGMAGDVILDALEERFYDPRSDSTVLRAYAEVNEDYGQNPLVALSCVDGYQFTKSSKQGLLEHLRNLLSVGYRSGSGEEFGWLRCPPIVQLEEELSFYAWDDKQLDTDTVMALALASWQGLELTPGESMVGSPYGS